MFDRYNLKMSRQQQQLLMAWGKQFPVTPWEQERNKRITAIMGHPNPFVTQESIWNQGYKTVGDEVAIGLTAKSAQSQKPTSVSPSTSVGSIIGNGKSHVYNPPEGCPSYDKVSSKTQVTSESESAAKSAGYRKAGNCK
nr:endonuclease [Pseudomonas marginalis]